MFSAVYIVFLIFLLILNINGPQFLLNSWNPSRDRPLDRPRTISSGRGAASSTVFQEILKTNWHGRLGRTHMADVDALPPTALSELDRFLSRKLHALFPRGGSHTTPDADSIFASLAALGLRLEDRGAYADLPIDNDDVLHGVGTARRGRNYAAWYYTQGRYEDYWKGFAVETLVELARYRGLFDNDGFLRAG